MAARPAKKKSVKKNAVKKTAGAKPVTKKIAKPAAGKTMKAVSSKTAKKTAVKKKTSRAARPSSKNETPAPRVSAEIAAALLEELAEHYPGAECALLHESPLELLVATILSASAPTSG